LKVLRLERLTEFYGSERALPDHQKFKVASQCTAHTIGEGTWLTTLKLSV